jgi:hypothetical protein
MCYTKDISNSKMNTCKNLITLIIIFLFVFSPFSCKKEKERIMRVSNDSISGVSYTTARAYATIIDPGEGIDQHGHCWSTDVEPTILAMENITENGPKDKTGPYSSVMTGLSPGTKYYVRAYVKNKGLIVYSADILPFTTLMVSKPVVTTGTVTDITTSSAIVSAVLNNLGAGASSVKQHGHCWSSETPTPVIDDNENKTTLGSRDSTGSYESELVGLESGTLYYVRAYATNDAETAYGEAISFSTDQATNVPSVVTEDLSSVTATSATCGGSIISDGGSPVIAKGVCWGTKINPDTSDKKTNEGTGSAAFVSEITGLVENTIYYVRAYATNVTGTGYGENVSFTASDEISKPTVTTAPADDITTTTAVCGGNVTYDGGADVTARGVCWDTKGTPTLADKKTNDGSGTGSFTSNITGLLPNTTYYVRAYATNSEGTSYGSQISFTTQAEITLPTVTTSAISSITSTSAQGGGNVTFNGGATVTARGVCWNTTGNPDILDLHTTNGSGTGSFTSNISGLSPNTTYYVRAYATNSAGTAYGDPVEFTTISKPTVITSTASFVTATTAQGGGNVTSGGGATITARGVCWNTTGNPTLADEYTNDGSGTGEFISDITALSPNTTYYVRAYATNSAGTSYGDQVDFTTTFDKPTVENTTISLISVTTAQSGGNVTSNGGTTVTAYGVCWSTSENPTIENNEGFTNDGSGTGLYTSNITGLSPNTTYYVRAYATNSVGTAYGNELSFTTKELINIDWQKLLGGSGNDAAPFIQQTTDGGYIVAGTSDSNDGDVSGHHDSLDYCIVKLTSTGQLDWQKSLGGSSNDELYSVQQTVNGGYIMAGSSKSNDGDVSGNHGYEDYWIVKLTSTGDIDWQKSLGGSIGDVAYYIQQTTDGGYIVAGWSGSGDGDVITGQQWNTNYWIVKLTSTGDIDWENSLGGSAVDQAFYIQQTSDGGYITAGYSESNDGDVTVNHGSEDYWIVKLTSSGEIDWQKSLGGSGVDVASSIQQTTDGGYIVIGISESNDGDVSGNHGGIDYWIVKLTSSGDIDWQKSLGSSGEEWRWSHIPIQQTTDGGYVMAGSSDTDDGDVSEIRGGYDYWIVKLTSSGEIDWQKSLGGCCGGWDIANSIQQTADGSYIVAGHSTSWDMEGHHGEFDFWIVKFTKN